MQCSTHQLQTIIIIMKMLLPEVHSECTMNANGFIIALKSEGLNFNTLTVEGKLLKLYIPITSEGKWWKLMSATADSCLAKELLQRST